MKYYLEWAFGTWFGIISLKDYCPIWDAKLNDLLDKYSDTAELNSYELRLGIMKSGFQIDSILTVI